MKYLHPGYFLGVVLGGLVLFVGGWAVVLVYSETAAMILAIPVAAGFTWAVTKCLCSSYLDEKMVSIRCPYCHQGIFSPKTFQGHLGTCEVKKASEGVG